jgi:hypothetical protein
VFGKSAAAGVLGTARWIAVLCCVGCGGISRPEGVDDALVAAPGPADPSGSTFVFADGAAPRVDCTACRGPSDCAANELCVPPASGLGAGLCAPGCTKEGFCASDRVCRSFPGVVGQADLRACVPLRACGSLRVGAERAVTSAVERIP